MGIFRSAVLAGACVAYLAGCSGNNERHIFPGKQVPYELRPAEMVSGEPVMIHHQYPSKDLEESTVFVGANTSNRQIFRGKPGALAVVLGNQGVPVAIGMATEVELSPAEFDSCLHLLHNAKRDSSRIRLYGHVCFEKDYLPFSTEYVGYEPVDIEGIDVNGVYISLYGLPERKR